MSTRTNTRPPLTPLIGRGDAVANAETLLEAGARLVTLVGGLGIGKTRVAHELATRASARDTLTGGVWWYEALPDMTGVAHCEKIAELLGAAPRLRGITDVDIALQAVGERFAALGDVYLFIDRLPNLLKAAPGAVVTWLRQAPGLTIVATSRQRFGLPGEHPVALGPLASASDGGAGHAEELFWARLDARRPGSVRSQTDQTDITRLVERLECNPLAIEVAAARCAVLTPTQLLARLDRGAGLLLGTPVESTPIRDALEEAWLALETEERSALLRLAVLGHHAQLEFVEAALSLSGATGDLDAADRALESLVLKSLVVQGGTPSTPEFGLNRHVLAFAREKLLTCESLRDETEARLERYVVDLARAATVGVRAAHFGQSRALILRATELVLVIAERIASRLPDGDAAASVAMIAIALESACSRAGVRERTLELLRKLQGQPTHATPRVQIGARALEGALHVRRGDFKTATETIDDAARLARELGDTDLEGDVLARAGSLYNGGDPTWAIPRVTRATELLDARTNPTAWAQAQMNLSLFELRHGEAEQATQRNRSAIDQMERAGLKGYLAPGYNNYSFVLATTGDWTAATQSFKQALHHAIEDGDRAHATVTQANLGQALLASGDDEGAFKTLTAAAASAEAIGDRRTLGVTASFFAGFSLLRDDPRTAREYAISAVRDLEFIWNDPLATGLACCLEAVAEASLSMPVAARNSIERGRTRLELTGDIQLKRAHAIYAAIVRFRMGEVSAEDTAALIAATVAEAEHSPTTHGKMNRIHHVRYAARFFRVATASAVAPVTRVDTPPTPAPKPTLRVSADGAQIILPSGGEVSLARKASARRVILKLVATHTSGRNEPVSASELFEVGWPGERIGEPYRSNRVYVLIAKLRGAGFGDLLRHDGEGYVLDPDVAVEALTTA